MRWFEPFSFKWYAWDTVYPLEPFMWLVLVLGLTSPALFGLLQSRIGSERRQSAVRATAIVALAIIVLMWGFRDYQHRSALAALKVRLYRGQKPVRASAYAYPWNPFVWHGVVETRDFFATMDVDTLHPEVGPQEQAPTYHKPEETPVTLAAKNSPVGRLYLDWARYPMTETETEEGSGQPTACCFMTCVPSVAWPLGSNWTRICACCGRGSACGNQ